MLLSYDTDLQDALAPPPGRFGPQAPSFFESEVMALIGMVRNFGIGYADQTPQQWLH